MEAYWHTSGIHDVGTRSAPRHNGFVISRNQQRWISLGVVAIAGVALGLGITYQGERLPEEDNPAVVGSIPGAASSLPDGVGGVGGVTSTFPTNPIEEFLPRSGQASACREPVGVDLQPGYAAVLTINGIEIAPEEMNVVLDEDGEPTQEQTASRSLGQYTFGPEENCPNGRVLRATDNVLQACVYRVEDGAESCVTAENEFDLL